MIAARFIATAFLVAAAVGALANGAPAPSSTPRAAPAAPNVGSGGASGLDADEVVRRLQERYEETRDFAADFTQTIDVAGSDRRIESHGTVVYERPGKMRWEFEKPEKQTIVADGTTLWIHQPADFQVIKAPYAMAFQSSVPVSFLLGVGRLSEDFTPVLGEVGEETIRVRLRAREGSGIGTLVLTVDRDTFDILGAEVTDPLGNVTRLELRNLERDAGVEDERFELDVPEGTDIVEPPDFPTAEEKPDAEL